MTWSCGPLVAEAFDVKAPIGHSYGDVEYYTRHLSGVGGTILEIGSGTGRILIRLLEAGLEVEGLEYSSDMIDICRKNAAARGVTPTIHEGDMTSFVRAGAYAAIIIPAGAISSLDGRESTRDALLGCMRSLHPGGRLIVDLEVPGLLTGPRPLRLWAAGDHVWTVEAVKSQFDAAANQVTEYVKYEKWTNGVLAGSELHRFITQHWVPETFMELLSEVGFTGIRCTANYADDARPGDRDHDWTFHAEKPAENEELSGTTLTEDL